MSWTDGPLIGFDTETTGVDSKSCRLVTASIIVRDKAGDKVTNWMADPGVEIPEAAAAVHGITTEYARQFGEPVEEVLEQVASQLADYLKAGAPIVAFNAGYDIDLMESELARHGLPTLTDRVGDIRPVLDPLVLDRALVLKRRGKRRLADLTAAYGVTVDDNLHNAEVDTRATLDLLGKMLAKFPHVGTYSLDELHEMQIVAYRNWAEDLEKFLRGKGRQTTVCRHWIPLSR